MSQSAHLQQEKYNELQKQYKILARQHSQLERDAFNSVRSSNIITCSGSNENGQENTTTPRELFSDEFIKGIGADADQTQNFMNHNFDTCLHTTLVFID